MLGRFRLWRELGGGVREIGGAVRGRPEVLEGFRAELEDRLRWERVSLGKEHSEAVRGIDGHIPPRVIEFFLTDWMQENALSATHRTISVQDVRMRSLNSFGRQSLKLRETPGAEAFRKF